MALSDDILKLLDEKDQRLSDVPLKYEKQIEGVQRRLFEELLVLIGRLDVVDGHFVISPENLDIATDIANTLRGLLAPSGYTDVLKGFASEFDPQEALNNRYFKSVFGTFQPGDIMDGLKAGSIRQLVAGALEAPFITPIRQRLEQAVSGGASLRDTIKVLKVDIEGGELDGDTVKGKLQRYVKQIMTNTFAQADRGYANEVGEDLDAQWRYYTKGTVTDSRLFCVDRNNGYYHKREVEDWGKGKDVGKAGKDWQGKISGTDQNTIFVNLGGWNCLHSIMPVGLPVVPLPDIKRNIAKGYFTPTEFERDFLGL